MGGVSEPRNKGGWLVVAAFVVAALVLLSVLYVLSAGPVFLLINNGYLSDRTADIVYAPLRTLSDRVPAVNSFMEWYVDLWVP